MGCTTCHEVRVNSKDVTHIKLVTVTPVKLCLQCHEDKDASKIKGHVHSPAVRDCLTCHDAHSADFKNILLKAPTGETKDNLCLSCHTTGLNVLAGGSRHAARIWVATVATPATKWRRNGRHFPSHEIYARLVSDCHDVADAALAKAHRNLP
jgi:predicted CXXCH cytochrome family protein